MAHIHVLEDGSTPDVRVAKADAVEADLKVFVVHDKYDAPDDQFWWYAPEPWGDDVTTITWVDGPDADLKVAFVDARYDAGWTGPHVLQNRL